jgi:hypothetical protein
MGSTLGAETIADRLEVRLEDPGSRTSTSEACTSLSIAVRMPNLRSFPPPPGLGIMRSRAGSGVNVRVFNCSRAFLRKATMSASSAMKAGITRSTPAVRAPLLPLTLSHATVRKSG